MKAWIAAGLGLALGSCKFDPPVDKLPIDGPPTARLTVTLIGGGPGRVTGGGVDCATGNVGTCAVDVPFGQRVTLTYAADTVGAGSQVVVDGWGGDCASRGTAATCEVVADVERVVTHGARLQHQVAVTLVASEGGQGTVTSTPAGLACASGTCNAFFDAGAEVTLTANPATPNDRVSTVTGDCSTMPCTLPALGGPRATTVTFLCSSCVPSTQTCTLGRFSQCDAEGNYVSYLVPNGAPDGTATTLVMNDYLCPLGCHATEPRCNDVDATNGLDALMDAPAVGVAGLDLVLPREGNTVAGVAKILTSTFDEARGEATIVDTDGSELRVPAAVVSFQPGPYPDALVLRVRSFTLRPGTTLAAEGARTLAIASHFDIVLAGTLDAGAHRAALSAGAGSVSAVGCDGHYVKAVLSTGGGGGASPGGDGSNSPGSGGLAGAGVSPLRGGCKGFVYGHGGGGVHLASRRRILLGAAGLINVGGAGGLCLWGVAEGGGGGGAVLLEAPTVAVVNGGAVAGRGGSGAACNADGGTPGNDGPPTGTNPAASVTCVGCPMSGSGGTELTASGGHAGTSPDPLIGRAGGGGGVGRAVVRARSAFVPPAGSMRIAFGTEPLGID